MIIRLNEEESAKLLVQALAALGRIRRVTHVVHWTTNEDGHLMVDIYEAKKRRHSDTATGDRSS